MPRKNHFLSSFLSIILIVSITLMNVNVAFADDGPTPEPTASVEPTVDPTEPPASVEPTVDPTEPPVAETPIPEATPVIEEATSTPEEAPSGGEPALTLDEALASNLLAQVPENTDVVVLDENGEALPLTSTEALDAILDTDPMWCPAGVLPGGAGCTTNFLTIGALITDIVGNTTTYDENGIIYFTSDPGASFSLTTSSLGATTFNTLNAFNLTLQGGWNGSNGAAATFTGQTNFATNTLSVGTAGSPWIGSITLNNFSFSGVSSGNAITVYTTTGNITLDNVDVAQQTGSFNTALLNSTSGNITVQNGSTFDGDNSGPPINSQSSGFSATTGTGSISISDTTFQESRQNGGNTYDGATLSAATVTLSNVTASGNDGNGIAISNATLVTLNNVTSGPAVNNQGNGLSGVLINGTGSTIAIVSGGTFADNGSYGIEILNGSLYVPTSPTCPTTGNTKNGSGCYNVTPLTDNTAPVITPTVIGTSGSGGWYTSDVTISWSVSDPETGIASSSGCGSTTLTTETAGTTITCSATNNAGLSSSNSVTIKIDKTGPTATLAVIAGILGSNGWYTSNVTIQTSGTDTISGPVTCTANQFQTTDTTGTVFNGSCTNNAGLATNASPLTLKVDKTGPTAILTVITGTAGNNGWYTSDVTIQTIGTDSTSSPVTCTANQSQTAETAGTVFNGSCTNNAGLTTNATPLTIKLDKTNPVIAFVNSTPSPNVNGWNNNDVTLNWSCTDGLSGPVTALISQTISTEGANQSATGTCQDMAGNSASDTQSGFNIDKTNPTLNLPANMIVEATSPSGVAVNYSASASDNLDASPSFSCAPVSGSNFVIGTTMVNCTATDHADNIAFGNFNITVQDSTGPVIAFHAEVTAEATNASGASVIYTNPATYDAVDGAGVATCLPVSGTTFALGDTTITCNATDAHNNTAAPTTFIIHIVDTTAPVIAAHADITAEATSASGAAVNYTSPTTSDIVDGAGTAICSPASGTTFALGNTTITCNAMDAHNNAAVPTTFIIHIVDTTAPVIAAHADVNVAATSPAGAVVNYTSPATSDAVDGAGVATCLPASGATFPLGNTTVTCNAIDAHGNAATPTTFVVHVIDTAAPVIDGHLDETVEATSAAGAIANYISPATSDAVDGTGVATCSPDSGTFFSFGDTTVTCNATDSNGNAATPTTFIVHVVDTTAPVILAHLNVSVITNNNLGLIVTYSSPSTSDSVDGPGTAACAPASGSLFPVGDTLVTCNATDAHGNSAQPITFTVHVEYQPMVPTPAPTTQTTQGNGDLSIPVTGGSLLNLDCLTSINVLGIKVTFHNLCGYESLMSGLEADTLPAPLPDGYSFVKGLNILVFLDAQLVKSLPEGTGVQLDFPIPSDTLDQFAVLFWSDEDGNGTGEWLEVTQLIKNDELTKVMSTQAEDEFYKIAPTDAMKKFYQIVSTDKTGTFIIVKK